MKMLPYKSIFLALAAVGLCLFFLTGCKGEDISYLGDPSDSEEIHQIKKMVSDEIANSDQAQFRGIEIFPSTGLDGNVVCGWVRLKDDSGAYLPNEEGFVILSGHVNITYGQPNIHREWCRENPKMFFKLKSSEIFYEYKRDFSQTINHIKNLAESYRSLRSDFSESVDGCVNVWSIWVQQSWDSSSYDSMEAASAEMDKVHTVSEGLKTFPSQIRFFSDTKRFPNVELFLSGIPDHLRGRPSCRRVLDDARELDALFGEMQTTFDNAEDGFLAKVMKQLRGIPTDEIPNSYEKNLIKDLKDRRAF